MEIQYCLFQNFRIYPRIEVELHPHFNYFIGNNGSGKTSFLEGISVLFSGRSFKGTTDLHLVRQGAEEYYLAGRIRNPEGSFRIETSFQKKKRKKSLMLDKKKVQSFKELLTRIPFVSFSGDDIRIITEGPVYRRQFFDRMIAYIEPSYYDDLIKYHRILKHRNELLKKRDSSQISFWDSEMALYASRIFNKRNFFVKAFNRALEQFVNLPESLENLYFEYKREYSGEEAEEKLRENREKDLRMGFSTWGPHRDEFPLKFGLGIVKHYASQGQIKALSFYLKLFQARFIYEKTRRKPALLIDDIFAELDRGNREKILNEIQNTGFQTLITSTKEDFLKNLIARTDSSVFHIHRGEILKKERGMEIFH
jgi:DNA replication and repair protein RecF